MRYFIAAALTLSVVAWWVLFRPGVLGGSATYVLVSGTSMQPTFYTGDLVIVRRQNDYQTGDVIAYKTTNGLVIHRIIGGDAEQGFLMQGDNKERPDPWHPKVANIAGKQWVHVPGGAKKLQFLRKPVPFALLLGSLVAAPASELRKLKAKRRPRRQLARTHRRPFPGPPRVPIGFQVALLCLATASMCFVALTAFSFRQPQTTEAADSRYQYTQAADFSYIVHSDPSILDESGVIGPITSELADGTESGSPAIIFTKLAHSIDLDIDYRFGSSVPPAMSGTMKVNLVVAAVNGWTKSIELQPDVAFDGSSATTHVTVDLDDIRALIQRIYEQTGFLGNAHTLSVIPVVDVTGSVGGEAVQTSYAPAFVFNMDDSTITPDTELTMSTDGNARGTVTRQNAFHLLGLSMPVRMAQILAASGAGLSVILTAIAACVVFLGIGRGPAGMAMARYGSMIIEVQHAPVNADAPRVDVASMGDLARLASREGRVIFYENVEGREHRYFVPDGGVSYQYSVVAGASEASDD